jgi:hypothetical protein
MLLARLAGRGEFSRKWPPATPGEARLQSWQRGLLAILGLDEASYPSAPVSALALHHDAVAAHWMQADAVHLAAGLNEVTLVPLNGNFELTAEECAALTPALHDHLLGNDLKLHRTSANGWLIESTEDWRAETVTAEFALHREWRDALPGGAGAGALRRLMTELQMVLHEHPVNTRRAAKGMPAANALWLWGNGLMTQQHAARALACSGSSDYLRGLARLHGWTYAAETSADKMLAQCVESPHVVGFVEVSVLNEFETQWLMPLVDALKRGRIRRLQLIIDSWEINIDRWRLTAFWRRDLPLSAWERP